MKPAELLIFITGIAAFTCLICSVRAYLQYRKPAAWRWFIIAILTLSLGIGIFFYLLKREKEQLLRAVSQDLFGLATPFSPASHQWSDTNSGSQFQVYPLEPEWIDWFLHGQQTQSTLPQFSHLPKDALRQAWAATPAPRPFIELLRPHLTNVPEKFRFQAEFQDWAKCLNSPGHWLAYAHSPECFDAWLVDLDQLRLYHFRHSPR